jgi:hypothetical protein
MSSKSLLAALAVFCLYASCKKNSNPGSAGNSSANGKARLYIMDYHSPSLDRSDTFHLSYDNAGRLTGAVSSTHNYTFSYPTTTSVDWDFVGTGQPSVNDNDFYANGLIDSCFRIEDPNDSMVGKYMYTGNLLSKEILSWISGGTPSIFQQVSYTYDANGNAIKTVQTDGQNSYQYINEYTYTDKPAQLPVVLPVNIQVPAKNLPATQVISIAGSQTKTITFTYVFDASGRLTKETDSEDDGEVTVKTFTY